jgi:ribosomal protein S18 acetylase RimI-like enzyme
MSGDTAAWSRDEFLGRCLGKPVFRLKDAAAASAALEAARAHDDWMIEARTAVDDVPALARLTALGFRVIDTNVQLDCAPAALAGIATSSDRWSIRRAQQADRDAVRELCAAQMTTSRFHLDPRIGAQASARVKRDWVGNFFDGTRGDGLYVVDADGAVAGFLLVLVRGSLGVIDLIAVEPGVRGTGAAGALVAAWREATPQLERIVVGTQISNTRSLRAYGKLGFRVCGATYVLHRHAGDD